MHPGRLLLIAVFLVSSWFAMPAFAEPTTPVPHGAIDCSNTPPADGQDDAKLRPAQHGCCYESGGICGCSAFGPVMCCDGRLSPTCMCRDGSPVTTLASMPE